VVVIGSLLLILGAVALLGLGLVQGSNAFLVGSIAASLLAAVALVVGARRAAAARTPVDGEAYEGLGDEDSSLSRPDKRAVAERAPREGTRRRTEGTVYGHDDGRSEAAVGTLVEDEEPPVAEPVIPSQHAVPAEVELDLGEDVDDDDPPDEPAAQIVPPADAARVARMSAQVLVIDGRPRYHQAGCVHLLGRESEPLPVSEAVELGFTPCSLCEPDSALLADARRV
jgi:hypothetical protein